MCTLMDNIYEGFPDVPSELGTEIRQYHQYREHLVKYDGVILYKDRVVIPPALRERVLQTLHSAHQGVSMMTTRAEGFFFWPGMTLAIEVKREKCTHYLVVVDRYSNWPIGEMHAEGSAGLIAALRRIFVTHGISEELSSDGGPEFAAGATRKHFYKIRVCVIALAVWHTLIATAGLKME